MLLESQALVSVPYYDKFEMKMVRVDSIKQINDLKVNKCGIQQHVIPDPDSIVENVDYVVTPGVAFTTDGVRLGHGGGYYDKWFKKQTNNPVKIAICFDLQIREFQGDEWDVPVDVVITGKRSISCKT